MHYGMQSSEYSLLIVSRNFADTDTCKSRSPELGLIELRFLLDICPLIYNTVNSWIVTIKRPKHLTCTHLGNVSVYLSEFALNILCGY